MAEKRKDKTFKAACEKIGCGRSKLYDLIAEEKIVAYKDGRMTKVDDDSIDAYLTSRPRLVIQPSKRLRARQAVSPPAPKPDKPSPTEPTKRAPAVDVPV